MTLELSLRAQPLTLWSLVMLTSWGLRLGSLLSRQQYFLWGWWWWR